MGDGTTRRDRRSGGKMTGNGKYSLAICVAFLTSLAACSHPKPVADVPMPDIVVPQLPVVL
jgi:hypothetical protein